MDYIVSIPLRYGTTFQVMLVVVLAGILVDEMCQFLLGTVQRGQVVENVMEYLLNECQFLLGTVQHDNIGNIKVKVSKKCQFLLGTVQHDLNTLDTPRKWLYVSIPLRYGTTWPEKNCSI